MLVLVRETGLRRLGTVSIDGTRSTPTPQPARCVTIAQALRSKLATDIAALSEAAEAADAC